MSYRTRERKEFETCETCASERGKDKKGMIYMNLKKKKLYSVQKYTNFEIIFFEICERGSRCGERERGIDALDRCYNRSEAL